MMENIEGDQERAMAMFGRQSAFGLEGLNIPDKVLKVEARSMLVTRLVRVLMSSILSSASGCLT